MFWKFLISSFLLQNYLSLNVFKTTQATWYSNSTGQKVFPEQIILDPHIEVLSKYTRLALLTFLYCLKLRIKGEIVISDIMFNSICH